MTTQPTPPESATDESSLDAAWLLLVLALPCILAGWPIAAGVLMFFSLRLFILQTEQDYREMTEDAAKQTHTEMIQK